MAKLSDLISTLSGTLGLELATVAQFARHTREAGFIRQGGRGLGAPDMQPSDCAHLLIAIMGSTYAKDSAKSIRRCSSLVAIQNITAETFPKGLRDLPRQHKFIHALVALIESAKNGDVPPSIHKVDPRKQLRDAGRENSTLQIPQLMVGIVNPIPHAMVTVMTHVLSEGVYLDPTFLKLDYQRIGPPSQSRPGDLQQIRHITNDTLVELGKLLNH
jgi:hypothetical protein